MESSVKEVLRKKDPKKILLNGLISIDNSFYRNVELKQIKTKGYSNLWVDTNLTMA